MSTKNSRSGGKYSGNHTSVISAAKHVCDIAHIQPEVTKISLGFVKAGLKPTKGKRRVKITLEKGVLFIAVRGNTSLQKLVIYSDEPRATSEALKQALEKKNFLVTVVETESA